MQESLSHLLHHRNPFVRKAAAAALTSSRAAKRWTASNKQFGRLPPVFANSVPKSGTHLLDQLLGALPAADNLGAFLSSMTSSFQFHRRTSESEVRFLRGIVPGELVRGHLFHSANASVLLAERNAAVYLIYRDPRDVVLSEAHYLRKMNRWHRLHPYFRDAASLEDAVALGITGFQPPNPGLYYPSIADRFAHFEPWLNDPSCLALRFEDLVSDRLEELAMAMFEHYQARCDTPHNAREVVPRMLGAVAPQKSHTFRTGKRRGWREEFTPRLRKLFAEIAGPLLIELGYESDDTWVDLKD